MDNDHSENFLDEKTVTPQSYRDAMSYFAAAVHIVTTDGDAGRRGVTISACCSLSDAPPTVLVCLMRQKSDNKTFLLNQNFCINTLSGDQRSLSDVFAGRGGLDQEQRFLQADWLTLKTGAPVLKGALAAFDCRLVSFQQHATHFVLIGEVVGVKRHKSHSSLMYLDRRYHLLELNAKP